MSTRVAPASKEFLTSSKIATKSFVIKSLPITDFRAELILKLLHPLEEGRHSQPVYI